MTTMLEKMARATYAKWIEDVCDLEPEWDALPESHRARLIGASRAALQAIRDADPKIIEAGCLSAQDGVGCTPWDNARAWEDGTDGASRQGVRDYVARAQTAMIDAILNEKA